MSMNGLLVNIYIMYHYICRFLHYLSTIHTQILLDRLSYQDPKTNELKYYNKPNDGLSDGIYNIASTYSMFIYTRLLYFNICIDYISRY